MVDRFLGLRHNAVVRSDDDDTDIGHLRAAGTHCGKRFVARRIQERDLLALDTDLIGADVLRDAAEFTFDNPRLPDRVQQRGLAVIDMPHDRNDRRALNQIRRIFFNFIFQAVLINRNFFLDFNTVLHAD